MVQSIGQLQDRIHTRCDVWYKVLDNYGRGYAQYVIQKDAYVLMTLHGQNQKREESEGNIKER